MSSKLSYPVFHDVILIMTVFFWQNVRVYDIPCLCDIETLTDE